MKLRKRLILSNVLVFLIPLLVTATVLFIVFYYWWSITQGATGKELITITSPLSSGNTILIYIILVTLAVFITSFLVVNLIISMLFTDRIVSPVKKLEKAAQEIGKGNLDHEMIVGGDEEIKKLCEAFEYMRLKLKESVRQSEKAEENRKILISCISHDLKTPVASIMGYVDGLLDGVADTKEKSAKYLNTIKSKSQNMVSLIDDLLLYAKLDMKQIPFNFEKTEVLQYIEELVDEFRFESEYKNSGEKGRHIDITLENYFKKSVYAYIDKEQMKRVFANIFENAVNYMDKEKGIIQVILRENKTDAIIETVDNGPGIPEAGLVKVFERFCRLDQHRKSNGGSGLGLAIAKQITEGHNGKIWAGSRLGEGTSIMVALKKV